MKILTSLILIAVLVFIVFAQNGNNPQIVWEYKFENRPNEKKANELGLQGWELVAIQNATDKNYDCIYIFKRVKK